MTRNRRRKSQMITMIFTLIVLFSSISLIFPIYNSNSEPDFNEIVDEIDDILPRLIKSPRTSKISSAPWWNSSWQYRRLINVTNPKVDVAFTNYTTSVVFNHTLHTAAEALFPMHSGLNDIRIVQDGKLKKYYYQMDYPSDNLTTVWFDVDIDQGEIDTDNIFLYFNGSDGNPNKDSNYYIGDIATNNTKDAMGWVRNGDFELDYGVDIIGEQYLTDELFGWTYTNTAPSSFDADGEYQYNVDYQHNLTDSNVNQERTFGNWSFKWGDLGSWLDTEDKPKPPPEGYDFEGTLYTYPFIVPTVEGTGADLKLKVYRNFRVYNTDDDYQMGFYIRLC
ncbi:MAG: hypothetical protein ACFFC3_14320, partial [Candidatus Odinarchaeota archaeon]